MDAVTHYLKINNITIEGTPIELSDVEWPTRLAHSLRRQNFTEPNCIQAPSWPVALAGRDLVGIAQTGSGKTLAYIFPGIMRVKLCRPQTISEQIVDKTATENSSKLCPEEAGKSLREISNEFSKYRRRKI